MSEEKKYAPINVGQVCKTLWSKRAFFVRVWIITFVLSCVWIFPRPRYYKCEVSIAPESKDKSSGGSLSSLASSFGLNIGNMMGSSDAIYPQLYPELFESTDFLVGILDIRVTMADGEVSTDYYTYMKEYQKPNYLTYPLDYCKESIRNLFKKEEAPIKGKNGKRFDPFHLNQDVTELLESIEGKIKCTYSKTTEVVTIVVTDQDPLVCALMADSIKVRLQNFITNYRTQKARIDYEHYKKITMEAKNTYEKARQLYATFADANQEVSLASFKSKEEDLENDMQLKYNIYTAMNTRLEAAMAKVQERTPAFTTLKNATVPAKPAGPKRVIFVLVMLVLSTLGGALWIYRKQLTEWF
jgi:hypothetical protein